MEVSIKWNICRLCLYEEQSDEQNSAGKSLRHIPSKEMTAKQIFDCSGVVISLDDGLPDKICQKCLTILNRVKKFRKSCMESEKYLQTVIQRTKSASTLFNVEHVGKDCSYDDLQESFEEPIEDSESVRKMTTGEISDNLTEDSEIDDDDLLVNRRQNDRSELATLTLNLKSEVTKNDVVRYSLRSRKKQKSTDSLLEAVSCVETESGSGKYIITRQLPTDEIVPDHNQFEETLLDEQQFYVSPDSVEMFEVPTSHCMEDDTAEVETMLNESKIINSELSNRENIIERGPNGDDIVIELLPLVEVAEEMSDAVVDNTGTSIDQSEVFTHNAMTEEFLSSEHVPVQNNSNTQTEEDNNGLVNGDDSSQEDYTTFDNFEQNEGPVYSEEDYVDQEVEDGKSTGEAEQLMILKSTVHRVGTSVTMSIGPKESNPNSRKFTQSVRATKLNSSLYVCHICGNHFTNRQLMNGHLKVHRQEKTHECELCFKRFITSCNLQAHMRIHTGEKPYECNYCKRRFTDRSTHLRHERIHTNEKPFPCKECGKSFSLATSLQAHKKVHSGERPYKCTLCAKSFKLAHQLKAHKNSSLHKSVEQLGS